MVLVAKVLDLDNIDAMRWHIILKNVGMLKLKPVMAGLKSLAMQTELALILQNMPKKLKSTLTPQDL